MMQVETYRANRAGQKVRRIGVIGLGAISKYYLDAIAKSDRLDLTGVCDLNPEKLAPFANSGVVVSTNYQEFLSAGGLDGVVITLPNDLHFEAAHLALFQGLHVICEKPLCISPKDAETLVQLAKLRSRVLLTAFHRRYNTSVMRMVEQVHDQGSVRHLRVRYFENIAEHCGTDRWYLDPQRCGGGATMDNGPNALDLVRLFVGQVTLQDAHMRHVDGADTQAHLTLLAAGGAQVSVQLDWDYRFGELKDLEVELADGNVLRADMLRGYPAFKSSLAHEYEGVLTDFVARLDGKHARLEFDDQGVDGAEIARLIDDAYRSARPFSSESPSAP